MEITLEYEVGPAVYMAHDEFLHPDAWSAWRKQHISQLLVSVVFLLLAIIAAYKAQLLTLLLVFFCNTGCRRGETGNLPAHLSKAACGHAANTSNENGSSDCQRRGPVGDSRRHHFLRPMVFSRQFCNFQGHSFC